MYKLIILILLTGFSSVNLSAQEDTCMRFFLRIGVTNASTYEDFAGVDVKIYQAENLLEHQQTNFDGELAIDNICAQPTGLLFAEFSAPGFKTVKEQFSAEHGKISFLEIKMDSLIYHSEPERVSRGFPLFFKSEGFVGSGNGFHFALGSFGIPTVSGLRQLDGGVELGVGGSIGLNAIFEQQSLLLGPRLTGEYHVLGAFCGGKFSLDYLVDFDGDNGVFFLPEFGLSLYGLLYIMAGYNVNLNSGTLTTLEGWRFNIGLNIPF